MDQKAAVKNGSALPLMESFYTMQGEGYYTGSPAFFIRLGGCDVGCHWCDTKDSWDVEKFPLVDIDEITKQVLDSKTQIAVIPGGEPFMHNLGALTLALKSQNIKVHLETSGAHPLSGEWDWICLSPKKFLPPLVGILGKANELKVVVHNNDDFKWGEDYRRQVNGSCKLYLQPEWGRSEIMMDKIKCHIQDNPEWMLSVQTHKYLGIP